MSTPSDKELRPPWHPSNRERIDFNRLTFETTYEFQLYTDEFSVIRLWFHAPLAESRHERYAEFLGIRERIQDQWHAMQLDGCLTTLASWIAINCPGVAAVQTMDKATGFGNVVYVDWP